MMITRPGVKDSPANRSDSQQSDVFQEVKGHPSEASHPNSSNHPNQSTKGILSPLMGMKECSVFLGIAEASIYKLTSQRKIPFSKVGRRNLFNKEDILAWVASKNVPQEPE